MIFTLTSKNYGKFKIDFDIINTRPDKVKEVLGHMIVVQAEPDYVTKGIVYVALCDLFDAVQDGAKTPDYNLSFDQGKLKATKL